MEDYKTETEIHNSENNTDSEKDISSMSFDSDVPSEEIFDNLLLVKIEQI